MIGIYFPTWSSPWTSDSSKMDLANVNNTYPSINCVYLSFSKPDLTYTKGSFAGTGLEFSQDFNVVVGAIKILKSKGVIVMLSVGGGAYWSSPKYFNVDATLALMQDLGCDGIDVDWEVGVKDALALGDAIIAIRWKSTCKISFAGFSTGAYGNDGNTYKGMSIDAMMRCGKIIDWINIMSYDAGNDYDPLGALDCYRIYYSGPLNIGFCVGDQSWGGHLLTKDEVVKMATYSKNNNATNGAFIWCFGKAGDPSCTDIVSTCANIFNSTTNPVPSIPNPTPAPVPPTNYDIVCKVCNTVYRK